MFFKSNLGQRCKLNLYVRKWHAEVRRLVCKVKILGTMESRSKGKRQSMLGRDRVNMKLFRYCFVSELLCGAFGLFNTLPQERSDGGGAYASGPSGHSQFAHVGHVVLPVSYAHVSVDHSYGDFKSAVNESLAEMEALVDSYEAIVDGKRRLSGESPRLYHERRTNRTLAKLADAFSLIDETGRSKRDVLNWLATLLSVSLGLSNAGKVGTLADNEKLIHHDQVVTRRLVARTRAATKRVAAELGGRVQELETKLALEDAHTHLEEFVDRLGDALYEALQGRISRTLLGGTDLEKVREVVEKFGRSHNLVAVGGGAPNILASPRSILVTAEFVRVVFHVPLHPPEDSPLDLFHLRSSINKDKEKGTQVVPRDSLLAVSRERMAVTLTSADLALCETYQSVRICSQKRMLRARPYDCVSALFFGEELQLCEADVFPAPTAPYLVKNNKFRATAGAVTMACGGENKKTFQWGERTERLVGSECAVRARDFVIRRQPEAIEPTSFYAKLRNGTLPHIPSERVESGLGELRQEIDRMRANLTTVPKVADLAPVTESWAFYVAIGCGAALAGLLLTGIIWKCMSSYVELRRVAVGALERTGAVPGLAQQGAEPGRQAECADSRDLRTSSASEGSGGSFLALTHEDTDAAESEVRPVAALLDRAALRWTKP